MKPYKKYKDSGVAWIGAVPEHWEVKRLKYVVAEKLMYGANEASEFEDLNMPRYIRITDFGDNGVLRNDTYKSLPFEIAKDYFLQEGDILFARSGATVGKTFQFKNYKGKACFAGYLIKASPDTRFLASDFLYFYTKSSGYENWKNSIFIQATIQNIGADKYNQLEIPLPPLPEQTAIARYLDQKTGEIDQLIAQKERLLALWEEEKTALISQAVTRGLDAGAKMKDSGVAWLGEVPEHWEVVSLKRCLSTKITDGPHETPEFLLEGVPFISAEAVQNGTINFESKRGYISEDEDKRFSLKCKPRRDDIFIVKSGSTTGKVAIVKTDENFNIWSPLALVRANDFYEPNFYFIFCRAIFFKFKFNFFGLLEHSQILE